MKLDHRSIMKFAVLSLLPALVALAVPPLTVAAESPTHIEQADQIFSVQGDAGYRFVDVKDNPAFLGPYDPLKNSPVFDLGLLYLTPSFGMATVEAGFLGADSWNANLGYNHGADVAVTVNGQKTYRAQNHLGVPPDTKAPQAAMTVITDDQALGKDNFTTRQDTSVALRVRVPGYPAHVRANGRISTLRGDQELIYFGRSCGTSGPAAGCHIDSKKRALDQETKEYLLGADVHLGPVDLAYSHAATTFRDLASDPTDPYGTMNKPPTYTTFLPAGSYPHNVNPDVKSFTDLVKLNTNLTNRMVLAMTYERTENKNEDEDITRGNQRVGANLSYTISPALFLVARYNYDEEKTLHISAAAEKERIHINEYHAGTYVQSHRHAVRPWQKAHTEEIVLRYAPVSRWDISATVRQRNLEREEVYLEDENGQFPEKAEKSSTTHAGLSTNFRVTPGLKLDALLGYEWTSTPAYAVDTTNLLRYSLGAVWTPAPILTLQAFIHGFHGKNDDAESLQESYLKIESWYPGFERTVDGKNYTLMAALTPEKTLTFTAAYSLTDNDIEQDMLFGSAATNNTANAYISRDTDWVGRAQVLNLRAAWGATSRLTVTAEGMWMDGTEYYEPDFAKSADLKEFGTVDLTKLLASLKAEYSFTEQFGLTLSGFWATFNSNDDAEDGRVVGGYATVVVKL